MRHLNATFKFLTLVVSTQGSEESGGASTLPQNFVAGRLEEISTIPLGNIIVLKMGENQHHCIFPQRFFLYFSSPILLALCLAKIGEKKGGGTKLKVAEKQGKKLLKFDGKF